MSAAHSGEGDERKKEHSTEPHSLAQRSTRIAVKRKQNQQHQTA